VADTCALAVERAVDTEVLLLRDYRKTGVSGNTGNLRNFRPFDSVGLGGGDDDDRWRQCVLWTFGLGAFEGPAGDFSFDDAGVGASPSWWEQAA